jgi:Protein of unknown function (DUF2569)/GYF domain 2
MKDALPTLPNAKEVLVWRDGFSNWTRAGDVPELRARTITPPPLPPKTVQRVDNDGAQRGEPRGIAGWLILPILGTILAPLYAGYNALQIAAALAKASSGSSLKTFVWLELAFNIGLLVAWVIAITFGFRHKREYPVLFVSLVGITLAGSLVDLYVATQVFNLPFDTEDAKAIMRPLITLLIWGPYMFLSKRVRNTFVK